MVKIESAIILCGGKSTRMGFDKQNIRIHDRPIVLHIASQLEPLVNEIIIVTNTPERYDSSGYRVVGDVLKDCGPIAGVYSGLLNSSSQFSYVVAGDMPFINQDYIRYLEKILKSTEEDLDVLAMRRKGIIEPFHAAYSKSVCPLLYEYIQQKNYRLYKLIESANTRYIEEREGSKFDITDEMFINLNTVRDLDDHNL
ncbi:molybdenum cofactor guanylyltransferase [Anaeromicropila populeti]|uniref:Probable molybdenum cofactor guanylyltransferase n=1 Tax=Anaeromicropila populeti TaxID=37658 RepID=A0A1I6HTQ4_9FIRM|nr:molybdenum cofactor guanylyltransferase [Anaeromicropila populeti]SFR57630.1 molybdopterin-guanine dinucleotide biosynthesis protein A [Anaeromicropila populeti]